MHTIVDFSSMRKDFIAASILKRNLKIVGMHRLIMNAGSDSFQASNIQGVERYIKAKGIEFIVYELVMKETTFLTREW